jgi:hypothetical protein
MKSADETLPKGDPLNKHLTLLEAAATAPLNGTPQAPHILDEVHTFLGRFVSYPSEHAHVAHTLWIAHTHLMDKWESTPRAAFLSPEPGSGKTRALEITETLVPRPVEAVNATAAYLFRKVSDPAGLPTILFDEIDTIFGPRAKEHEEIRGILNAGHRRGAVAGRCVVKGRTVVTEEFPAFCAVAVAGLGNLPDTILTRSVNIKMRRRAPTEQVEAYRRRIHAPEGHRLREQLAEWAIAVGATINLYPSMPEGVTDRPADVWEALLSVADAAAGAWPERARVSCVSFVSCSRQGQDSLGLLLLKDIQMIFGYRDAMWTSEILEKLNGLDESPWGDFKGKPLDARSLAKILKPYGVERKQIRIGASSNKGYARADLHDAWVRYLPTQEGPGLPSTSRELETSESSGTWNEPDQQENLGFPPADKETGVTSGPPNEAEEVLADET